MPSQHRIYYGWWIVLYSFLLSTYMGGTVFYSYTAFIDPITREFGWSITKLSLVSTIRGVEIGIFSVLVGFLVDRFGTKAILLFGLVTVGLGQILFSMTMNMAWFFMAFFLLSLGAGGCTSVVLTTGISNWFNRNMGKALGFMAAGYGGGGVLVPLVVLLIDTLGWRAALMALGVLTLLLVIPVSLFFKSKPDKSDWVPESELLGAGMTDEGKTPEQIEQHKLGFALKDPSFWYFNIAEAMRMMVISAVMMHIMPYLSSVEMSRALSGFVAAAVPAMSILGRVSIGWMADLTNKKAALFLTYLTMAVGMLCFVYSQNHLMLIPFAILFPFGYGGSMPLRGLTLKVYYGPAVLGRLLGISMSIAAGAAIFSPVLAGMSYDYLGSYRAAWLGGVGLLVVAMAMIVLLKPIKAHGEARASV